ncbi:MAG: chitobiase/beta-hexosaminidase C-terminal domain-containing protein, partial [bacterium]
TQYTGPITVSSTSTIKAIAYRSGYTQSDIATGSYTVSIVQKAATPTLSPASGTFTSATQVTISCTTTGATIFYTTDGSTPVTSSTQYTGPITISSTSTIKAIAYRSGYTLSDVATGSYTVSITQKVATPTLTPTPGTFTAATPVTMACTTPNAIIRYTTDGTTPTATSTAYTGAITVSTTTKITAVGFLDQWTPSGAVTGYYIISIPQKVATPAFSIVPGTLTAPTQVGITCATTGAVIRYTTDGTAPSATSTMYTAPVAVTKTTTINAKAFKTGNIDSDVLTGTYTLTTVTPTQGVDLMIKTTTTGTAIGEGIIDTQGTQVATKSTAARKIASYVIVLKNTGNTIDYFTVTAVGAKTGWYVNFADPAGINITQKVTGGYGWLVPAVTPGKSVLFRLDVSPLSGTANYDSLDVTITATSKTSATKTDQVVASTTKVQ